RSGSAAALARPRCCSGRRGSRSGIVRAWSGSFEWGDILRTASGVDTGGARYDAAPHDAAMTIHAPLRLAVWCCPRTVSTALMRSFENRGDTFVCDEPLYAHYLATTGKRHALADEVVRSQPTDWREVAAWLTGPVPEGRSVFYQKHMAHHLLPNIERN